MPDAGLVSCIVPVCNGARFLAESIESVLAQPHRPLEIIVVDDGSTDGTPDVIASFGGRVRGIRQENAGPSAARNRGVAEAEGAWIAFQDADDLWEPFKLELQLASFARNPALGLSVGHLQNFWEPELRDIEEKLRDHPVSRPQAAWGPPLMLMRRETFDLVGPFDPALRTGEDTDWLFRAREKGVVAEVLPEVILRRRRHGRNLTANWSASADGMFAMLKRSMDRRRGAASGPPATG
ncbi:MAG TPA: glycosyltransferase family A protein [Gemmatimonadales bacterium]